MKELNVFCLVVNLAVTAFIGIWLPILPTRTRRSFLFGVKIPPSEADCAAARGMKRRYVALCLAGTALIAAGNVIQFVTRPDLTLLAGLYFPLLFVVVQAAAFVPNHRAAARLKAERGLWVSDAVFAETRSSHTRGTLSAMPKVWYVAGLLVVFVSFAVVFALYPRLPDSVPTHFDFRMEPNRWRDKSLGTVLTMPIISLITLVFLWAACAVPIEKAKLQIDANDPARSFAQHRVYRRRVGHAVGFLSLCMSVMFLLIDFPSTLPNVWPDYPSAALAWLGLALMTVAAVVLVVVMARAGQGGCRIKVAIRSEAGANETPADARENRGAFGRGDDRFWVLGLFYHNPDDPARLVEDRFGLNLGFNYARLSVKIGVIAGGAALILVYAGITVWWLKLIAG